MYPEEGGTIFLLNAGIHLREHKYFSQYTFSNAILPTRIVLDTESTCIVYSENVSPEVSLAS
jgi:hypothetical protein